jgi:hypothetical protein
LPLFDKLLDDFLKLIAEQGNRVIVEEFIHPIGYLAKKLNYLLFVESLFGLW